MPLPTFLALMAFVILAAGASVAAVHLAGLSFVWLSLPALLAALAIRALRWQ